jgi:hypothetical protein
MVLHKSGTPDGLPYVGLCCVVCALVSDGHCLRGNTLLMKSDEDYD